MAKHFHEHFQSFSILIHNESLPMKIWKCFDKEREKTLMQQSKRKEKLGKVGLCFITGCFIKSCNMIINHFLLWKIICSPIFAFWYQEYARNIKRWSRERQIAKNGKLQCLFQEWFQSFGNEHNTNNFFLLTKFASMTLN